MKIFHIRNINLETRGAHSIYFNTYHIVFATKNREPYLTPILKIRLRNWMRWKLEELGSKLILMNGYLDHLHILVSIPSTLSLAKIVKHIKGYTSWLMGNNRFWQEGYFAHAVNEKNLEQLFNYIRNQAKIHKSQKEDESWEKVHAPKTYPRVNKLKKWNQSI